MRSEPYRAFKLWIVVGLVGFSSGVLYTHISGGLFPGLPLGLTLAILSFAFGGVSLAKKRGLVLIPILLLSITHRAYTFFYPANLLAFDPDAHAVRSQIIISEGSLDSIKEGFYHDAPLFNILGAEASILSGTPVEEVYVIYPIIVGLILPLFAGILSFRVSGNEKAGLYSTAIVAVGASTIKYGNAPIPLTLAAIFVSGAIVSVILLYKYSPPRASLLFCIFLAGAMATHKMPIMIIAGIILCATIYAKVISFRARKSIRSQIGGLALISLIYLSLQWVFFTTYVQSVVERLLLVLGFSTPQTSVNRIELASATVFDPPLLVKFFDVWYFFVTVGIGAFAGLELFRRYNSWDVRILQSAALVTAGISIPGIFLSAAPGFFRVYVYGTAFVAALIGIGIMRLNRSNLPHSKVVAFGIIFLVIVANPLSAIAWPDSPNSSRDYLNSAEVEAKHYSNDMIQKVVYMDMFYGAQTVDFSRAARVDPEAQDMVPQPRWHTGLLSQEFLDGSLHTKGYEYIALRPKIDIYRLAGGHYTLNWEPEEELDRTHNRIYGNGDVVIYNNRTR